MVSFGTNPSREMLAQAVINVLCEKYDISPAPTLVINGRLGKTLGRAIRRTNEIHINPLILNTVELGNTIRHEVAHFCAFKEGEFKHGPIWQKWAVICGAEPVALFKANNPEEVSTLRWKLTCPLGCKAFMYRKPRVGRICKKHHMVMTATNFRKGE